MSTPRTARTSRPRGAWRTLHRWSGLVLALPVAFAALTGAALAFHPELDRRFARALLVVEPRASAPLPLDAALAALARAHPGAEPRIVRPPRRADDALAVDLAAPLHVDGERWTTAFVDPHDGRVLGGRDELGWRLDRNHVMPLLWRLHFTLGASQAGLWTMGAVAAAWFATGLAGLALALPAGRRRAGTPRPATAARIAGALGAHRLLGLATVAFTSVIAFSAFCLAHPELARAPARAAGVALADPRFELPPSAGFAAGRDLGWSAALARVRAAAPDATVHSLARDAALGHYQARLIARDDALVRGSRRLMLDAATGEVLLDWRSLGTTPAERFYGWQLPLHTGQAFGTAGRAAVLALGLLIAAGVFAGLLSYARRAQEKGSVPFS